MEERHNDKMLSAALVSSPTPVISSPSTRFILVQVFTTYTLEVEDDTNMDQQPTATAILGTSALRAAVSRYHKALKNYESQEVDFEMGLRGAFQTLLTDVGHMVKWTLIPGQTLEGGIRPDGVLRDEFKFRRGYWETKGPKGNLDKEIEEKKKKNYPLTNTIFENTKRAILYQNKKKLFECDLSNASDVRYLLTEFFTYVEPDIANFEVAVQEFKERIPELAQTLLAIIEKEHKENHKFKAAFESFAQLCRSSLDPNVSKDTLNEMLSQHLLTERLFRTVFDNPDFVSRNAIASEIEKVILALTSCSFNRAQFLKSLDRFYLAIEQAARHNDTWSERQSFLNTVYERFFQGFAVKKADTHGIVYTPQEIVEFICASVNEILKREFGKSIAEPDVQILDPATGIGNFIVNLMRLIPSSKLKYKYQNDLFCNEIMLLPYYIASLNIEHEYYERMKEYESFNGICFADTLELAEPQQLSLFVEENNERIQHKKDAQIMVVIGNPPYNVGQKNENDNNKNRKYPVIDQRIRETYVKDSKAILNTQLYDAYVRFFRWATDRLKGHDGIVGLVTNNSFIDQITFDGMRKHLLQDFTHVYHLDLHGNVRKNPKISGTTHNVFGIQVGVGITIAIRSSHSSKQGLYYYRVPEYWRKTEKLAFLTEKGSIVSIEWDELKPDISYNWINKGIKSDFSTLIPIGTKEAKLTRHEGAEAIFKVYSLSVATNRDSYVYSFDSVQLSKRVNIFIDIYNSTVDTLKRHGRQVDPSLLIDTNDQRIKWTRQVKNSLAKLQYSQYIETHIRNCLYRPFTLKKLYFDNFWNEERYQQYLLFPTLATEGENRVICVPGLGDRKGFGCLAANTITSFDLAFEKVQCFPFYTYTEDGTNRRENITDWALQQFQSKYGPEVTKWDIFHYVYGLLHHPEYRERYKENLKRAIPHIPLLHQYEAFATCVRVGKQLMDIHLNYEQAKEYPLNEIENRDMPFSTHVEKMKLTPDRTAVIVNESLTLSGIPQECFQYRLGNRSALEWVIDQYQVSKDKRSGIESDPNRIDDPGYIVRLVTQVITVSVETVRLVNELAQAVTVEDWLGEVVEMKG
jgi:predicted helicase